MPHCMPVRRSSVLLFSIILAILSTFAPSVAKAQLNSWRRIADTSNNFYTIKAAFLGAKAKVPVTPEVLSDDSAMQAIMANLPPEAKDFEYVHFMRWASFVEPRVAETNGDLTLMRQRYDKAMTAIQASPKNLGQNTADNWALLGPVNQTNNMYGNGRVNNVRIDPTNPNILYACTPASQLFKTTNGGGSWTSISDGIPGVGVTDVAIDPTNTNILYAITGDGDQSLYHPNTTGLFKSTNGGATWASTGLSAVQANFQLLTSILVHPTSPNIILVSGTAGIQRSTNGGASFTTVSNRTTRDLVFMPGNPNIVFAGSNNEWSGTPGVFLRSVDNGASWTTITSGLPTNAFRYAIDVSPANPNMVYAMAIGSSYSMIGFYVSVNAGLTFKLMATTPNIGGSAFGSQGWYDLCVAADPLDPGTVYGGGIDIFKSIDSGKTWVNQTNVYGLAAANTHPDVHDLTFVGSSTLYVGNDGGVYKSTNGGLNWTNISSNLSIAQPYGIGISQSNANLMLSGHQDNGTNLTSNMVDWRQVFGGDGMLCLIDRSNDNVMYGSTQNGGLRRSLNGGTSWTGITSGFSGGNWVTPIIQDPVIPTTIYAGGTYVYKSTNQGTTWTIISPVFNDIAWIAVDRKNTQKIYAAVFNTVRRTTNGGTNWSSVNVGSDLSSIHIDQNNSSILYAADQSFSGASVYRSTDGGVTFSNWSTGLPNLPANIVVTQLGSPGEVYVGTDNGVYYRAAGAASWVRYSTNMPPVPVRDLQIHYPTSKMRAATFGRSVWESPLNLASACTTVYNNDIAYVNAGAVGANTGTTWANAFTSLQSALAVARTCGVNQIWVAQGTYKPTTGANRDSSFFMVDGVAIYGGFAPTGSPTFAQRNPTLYPTRLSGNIGAAGAADNSYHVVTALGGVSNTSILNGFVVADGNANLASGFGNVGAGLLLGTAGIATGCNPKIENCVFESNTAVLNGGAVYNFADGRNTNPSFVNCIFANNSAQNGGAYFSLGRVGGNANASFTNCTFSSNSVTPGGMGTAMHNDGTGATNVVELKNSILFGNGGANTLVNVAASVNASYSYLEPTVTSYSIGTGNLISAISPFVTPTNYRLVYESNAIDGGNALGAPTVDITGTNRLGLPDMGAFETIDGCIGSNKTFVSALVGTAYQWQESTGGAFVNVSNGALFSGATTNQLTLIAPAGSTTGYRYRCAVTQGAMVNTEPVTLRFYNRWLGTSNNSWSNTANWGCGVVPNQFADVILPTARGLYPLTNVSGTVRSLTAKDGSSISLANGTTLTILGN